MMSLSDWCSTAASSTSFFISSSCLRTVVVKISSSIGAGETKCRLNVGKFTAAQKRGDANVNYVA